jgi:hypothetical protein
MTLHILSSCVFLSLAPLADALFLQQPTARREEIPETNQAAHQRGQQRLYKRLADAGAAEKREHMGIFHRIGKALRHTESLTHSQNILEYVMSLPEAPALGAGCLYLPSDKSWRSFYSHIERPYPPLFAEMVAGAFYPECNATAVSGLRLPEARCGENHMMGSKGCFAVQHRVRASGVQIYETDGHIGLPKQWSRHIEEVQRRQKKVQRRAARAEAEENPTRITACASSDNLPQVPPGKKLVIPITYVVCTDEQTKNITREMIEDQHAWNNEAFKGNSPWERTASVLGRGRPEAVDMQIEFDLQDVRIVEDTECARNAFTQRSLATKYQTDPQKQLLVVAIGNDNSGTLGTTDRDSFTTMVTTKAFRGIGTEGMYDEGDTVVHEAGHAIGLFHTFETAADGASCGQGDMVDDTNTESMPHYTCKMSRSCNDQPDPVHNFMDYAPDWCMVGFTEGQKRRTWCYLENARPSIFKAALRDM